MRILWLKTELLHPVDKGGKIRTYQMLKELIRNHHVTYLTLNDGTAESDAEQKALEYCQELICVPHETREKYTAGFYWDLGVNLLSRLPYAIRKYRSPEMECAVGEQVRSNRFDIVVCDFLAPAVNLPSLGDCPSLLFEHNVEAMIWRRHFEVQKNALKKSYLRGQWQKMSSFERRACHQFDSVVAVSPEDRETLQREYEVANVYDIPTGVDIEFFKPGNTVETNQNELVFTGSMDWLPNEDGIRYFTTQILPLIKERLPEITLTVVGRNPNPALIALSKEDSSVVVTGRVDDVRPYMEKASAFVVPLRIGGGTRLKIFEAMAMEKPVISTSVGAEGLPLRDQIDVILADGPEDFARAVVAVLSDPVFAKRLGERGAKEVRNRFGWTRVTEAFVEICERTIAGASRVY